MDGDSTEKKVTVQDVPELPADTVEQPEQMAVEPPAELEQMQAQEAEPEAEPVTLYSNGAAAEDVTADEVKSQHLSDGAASSTDDVPNYKTKYIMSGHARSISAIKFSPDGTMLASCGKYAQLLQLYVADVWKLLTRSSKCGMLTMVSSYRP
jgi:WD40 repeat protein